MRLIIRLRKLNSDAFSSLEVDEEVYDINELQELINYGLENKSPVSIALKGLKRSIRKLDLWNSERDSYEYASISVLLEP